MDFISAFTRVDTSSLPVPETKFKGSEGERLGQLVVTPEVVVSKINNTRQVTRATHARNRVCPRVELILQIIIILLIIFLGFIKSKPC